MLLKLAYYFKTDYDSDRTIKLFQKMYLQKTLSAILANVKESAVWMGDAGAPLDQDETEILAEIYPKNQKGYFTP